MLTAFPAAARSKFALAVAVCAGMLLGMIATPSFASASQAVGVQTHLMWSGVDAAEVDRQLDAAVDLGASYVRVDAGWATLEQNGKGVYNNWFLNRLDGVVSAANSHGLKLILTLGWTPCWASSAPDTLKQNCEGSWWNRGVADYPPVHASDYGDAIGYLADRYRGQVAAWEVWNEPNLDSYFKTPDKVSKYAAIVKAAYPAVKASDPGAKVLAGALSQADIEFTRGLYAAGIKGSFDAFSIHPYSGDRSPLDSSAEARYTFINGVPAVHQVMVDNSDNKPLWLTEFGWNTSDLRGVESWRNGVSEQDQATYLEQGYAQMAQWSYVDVGIWYGLQDLGPDRLNDKDNFGLTRYDRSRKPAYGSFQRMAAAVASGNVPPPTQGDGTTTSGTTDTAGDGTTTKPPGKGRKPRVALRASRRGVLRISGRVVRADVLKVRVKTREGKSRSRTSHRGARYQVALTKKMRVRSTGRFSRRIKSRVFRSRRWVATAVLVRNGVRDRVRVSVGPGKRGFRTRH